MSDIGEYYQAMKDYHRDSKTERLLKADDTGWTKQTHTRWSRQYKGKSVLYWPATGTCRIGNKKYKIGSKLIQQIIKESNPK